MQLMETNNETNNRGIWLRETTLTEKRVSLEALPPVLGIVSQSSLYLIFLLIHEISTEFSRTDNSTMTLSTNKRTRIGTWDVQTLLELARLLQVSKKTTSYKIDLT